MKNTTTTVQAIENENGITTYSMIRVGQILKIPAAKTEVSKPATDPATAAAKHAFLTAKSDLPKPAATVAAKAETPKMPPLATPAPKPLTQSVAPKPSPQPVAHKPSPQPAAQKPSPQPAAQKPSTQPAAQKSSTQPAAPNKEEVAPAAGDKNTYTVAKGDNPYSIAKKLHVSYNELIAINEIKDPTRVQIGQKLKIPPRKN